MIGKGTTLVLLAALLCVLSPGDAHADDTAAAEATFQRGKAHMAAGRIAEACDDFALSAKLEASTGTFLNLGDCNQKLGKTASAWTSFMKAISHANDSGLTRLEIYAKKRADALRPKLTHAEIRANGALPNGSAVTRNGEDAALVVGVPVPLDPGEYVFMVKAPGFEDWSTTLQISGEGKTIVVNLPRYTDAASQEPLRAEAPTTKQTPASEPSDPALAPVVGAIDPSADATKESDHAASDLHESQPEHAAARKRRTLAFTVGGAGLAVVATGFVFGAIARSKLLKSNDGCDANNVCSQSAFDLRQDGESKANIATAIVGVGAVGVAAATYLWFTPPKARSNKSASTIAPVLMPGNSGVGFAISGAY